MQNLEYKLRESEIKYRTLTDFSMVGISIIQDMQIKIKYINQKLAEIFGYTVEDLGPNELYNNVHPDDLEKAINVSKANQEGRNPETPEHLEVRCLKKLEKLFG